MDSKNIPIPIQFKAPSFTTEMLKLKDDRIKILYSRINILKDIQDSLVIALKEKDELIRQKDEKIAQLEQCLNEVSPLKN